MTDDVYILQKDLPDGSKRLDKYIEMYGSYFNGIDYISIQKGIQENARHDVSRIIFSKVWVENNNEWFLKERKKYHQ